MMILRRGIILHAGTEHEVDVYNSILHSGVEYKVWTKDGYEDAIEIDDKVWTRVVMYITTNSYWCSLSDFLKYTLNPDSGV